jgi:hypothetical protein
MYIPAVHVTPQEVSYGEVVLKNFTIREVFIDGKQKGEYHIKLHHITSGNLKNMMHFFTTMLTDCEVGAIDITNTLNLEYHIYIKTVNQLKIVSMMSIMETLDEPAKEILK